MKRHRFSDNLHSLLKALKIVHKEASGRRENASWSGCWGNGVKELVPPSNHASLSSWRRMPVEEVQQFQCTVSALQIMQCGWTTAKCRGLCVRNRISICMHIPHHLVMYKFYSTGVCWCERLTMCTYGGQWHPNRPWNIDLGAWVLGMRLLSQLPFSVWRTYLASDMSYR